MLLNRRLECREFSGIGQVAFDEEIGDFEKRTLRSELFNRNAAIAQNAFVAVDECNVALRRAGVRVAGVEGDEARLRPKLRDVDCLFSLGADDHGQLDRLVAECQCCCFTHLVSLSPISFAA